MKRISFSLENKSAYNNALKEFSKKKYKSKLIEIFVNPSQETKIEMILKKISTNFDDCIIIANITTNKISTIKVSQDETIITLSLFKKTKLRLSSVDELNTTSSRELRKKICTKNTKAMILFSENNKDCEKFITNTKQKNPQIFFTCKLNQTNSNTKKTFIFYKNEVLKHTLVALTFSGKKVFVDNKPNLDFYAIGKNFTITSSEKNIVHEIDSKSALSVFKYYLGESVFQNNAAFLSNFVLLYNEKGKTISRTPIGIKGTSIVFSDSLSESQKVKFGFLNSEKLSSSKNESFNYIEFSNDDKNIIRISEKSSLHVEKDLKSTIFSALTHFIEQASHENEENLELLNQYKTGIDLTSLVSKTDMNGLITYVNENFCKISQYKTKELIGKNHNIIKDKNMSDFVFQKMWQTISNAKVWKGVISNKAKDGTIYYVDTTIMPILDKNENIVEYIAIRQDITKLIQSKQRIKEKEKLIKAIFDNQDSIVIYTSKTKGMISVNKKLFDYLNYPSIEIFKETHSCICDLFINEEGYLNPTSYPEWIDDIATGKISEDKAKILIKDGTVHTFKIIIKKMEDEYIINMYDITELEDAIKKAYASEQAKSTFLANMSHEIRTPLNGILGFTDILSRKDLDKDTKRYVEIMRKSGQTLLSVVNDILDFSKMESGELKLSTHEANLFEEMEAAVSTFASTSKNKHIEFYTFIDTRIPKTLTCDVQRIKQVLNNLVSNAIKFTPAEGSVHVDISLLNIKNNTANIKFSVKDTGIGIEQDKLELVFKSFSQADDSISRKFGGTGLGLSISSEFVEMMDSKLQLQSELGKGSEFFFILELPVIDKSNAVSDFLNENQVKIQVLYSNNDALCAINDIIVTYLNAWGCEFEKIYDKQEIDSQTNILIVCAKLFEEEKCENLLEEFDTLELIYIEGGQNSFNSQNKRFHHLEQPMTGSALFDKIITLTNIKPKSQSQKQDDNIKQFSGNILVAEDNETNQMLISIILQERGLDFKIVNNGEEALNEALANDSYGIIFMDINMPIMDGITATKLLRQKGYSKAIVSLSANVIESDIKSFKEAGVDNTLNKPIVTHELEKILSTYLEVSLFDKVNPTLVSQNLSINNLEIIKKLLISFTTSAQTMIEKLNADGINEDIMHNIKGVAGNLRFVKLYTLAQILENEFLNYDEKELQRNKELVISHLKNLQEQIHLIYM